MHIPYLETHRQNAEALYRQRLSWLGLPAVAMTAMLDLERRLRAHVFVLSRCVDSEAEVPGAPAALFAHLAARLSALEAPLRREAAARACDCLAQPGQRAEAAWHALMLFPHADAHAAIEASFLRHPTARAALLEVCAAQDMDLPRSWLDAGDFAQRPVALQAALLRHGARHFPIPGQADRHFAELPEDDDPLLAERHHAALCCALVRGDGDAIRRIHSALVRYDRGAMRFRLLRLLALGGASSAPALLHDALEEDPDTALALLALHGSPAAVEVILDALDEPRHAGAAAEAWAQVSGQTLDSRPRLSLVGSQGAANSAGEMPESAPARALWRLKAPGLRRDDRWQGGERLTPAWLIDQLSSRAGHAGRDQADLLAILLRQPVGIALGGCHGQRCQRLESLRRAPGMSQQHA